MVKEKGKTHTSAFVSVPQRNREGIGWNAVCIDLFIEQCCEASRNPPPFAVHVNPASTGYPRPHAAPCRWLVVQHGALKSLLHHSVLVCRIVLKGDRGVWKRYSATLRNAAYHERKLASICSPQTTLTQRHYLIHQSYRNLVHLKNPELKWMKTAYHKSIVGESVAHL